MIRHKNVSASGIEVIESDGFHADSSEANAIPCAEHEHSIEQVHVARDQRPRESDERGDGRGQGPKDEHGDGADHVIALFVVDASANALLDLAKLYFYLDLAKLYLANAAPRLLTRLRDVLAVPE